MFLLSKLESLFSIITTHSIMQYKFKNRIISKVLEKLVIAVINPFIYYLTVKIYYANPWLITKLIFSGIKLKVFEKTNFTNNSIAKPREKRRFGQYISR